MAELTAQLLHEIDGNKTHPQSVFLIGATNQPARINRALFNRFTEKIEYPLPSLEQCKRLLDLLIGLRPLASGSVERHCLNILPEPLTALPERDLRTMVERASICSISRERTLGRPLEFAIAAEDFLQAQHVSVETLRTRAG